MHHPSSAPTPLEPGPFSLPLAPPLDSTMLHSSPSCACLCATVQMQAMSGLFGSPTPLALSSLHSLRPHVLPQGMRVSPCFVPLLTSRHSIPSA